MNSGIVSLGDVSQRLGVELGQQRYSRLPGILPQPITRPITDV